MLNLPHIVVFQRNSSTSRYVFLITTKATAKNYISKQESFCFSFHPRSIFTLRVLSFDWLSNSEGIHPFYSFEYFSGVTFPFYGVLRSNKNGRRPFPPKISARAAPSPSDFTRWNYLTLEKCGPFAASATMYMCIAHMFRNITDKWPSINQYVSETKIPQMTRDRFAFIILKISTFLARIGIKNENVIQLFFFFFFNVNKCLVRKVNRCVSHRYWLIIIIIGMSFIIIILGDER